MDATLLLRGAWVGVGWDVNVHLHAHTTWMLRCCYVGHGLGWGGMLTFICTCTPRGCYVAATWVLNRWHSNLGQSMAGFEKVCSFRDHSKGCNQQKGESCVVGLDLQLNVAPQL